MSRFSRGIDRRDAKQLSKNRFARLDADITSAYDDEDDSPAVKCVPISRNGGTVSRVINRLAGGVLHGRNSKKKDQQVMRGAAGASKNAEMVFKIRIPQGRKYTIAWVMRQLHQQVEELKPLLIAYTQKGDIEFLLKSEESAEALRAISRRIVHKNTGDRVTILSDKIVAPWNKLNKTEVEVINAVVDSRFNYDSRALDLSEFALDPKFKERDLHMMLNKNNVMLTAIDRIDEKYGTITALSLQGNRLRFLDYAAVLTSVTKFVKVLDLSNNQIDKISELDKLKGLPVETLFFEGNPLCEQLTNATAYLRSSLKILGDGFDGTPVQAAPHVPTLEDEETTNEPPTRASGPGFYSNDNLRILVERFLVEFFKQYDGENAAVTRKNLMAAYDADNSMFTLTIANMRDSQLVRYPNE
uniref:Tap-RNA_bind domain-containing protein n=1 Tax=Heterorhabditis bacteriophora TaxID=37862 RepID=A0A1I7XPB3_HETBA